MAGTVCLKTSPLLGTAEAMRAILSAKATKASQGGFRSNRPFTLARRPTAIRRVSSVVIVAAHLLCISRHGRRDGAGLDDLQDHGLDGVINPSASEGDAV